MTTLRRNLRLKFEILINEGVLKLGNDYSAGELAEHLADVAIEEFRKSRSPSPELVQEAIVEANKSVDAYLELSLTGAAIYWKGRDIFADNHLHYADWYHEKTNQVCNKRQQRAWMKAFSEWQDAQLSLDDLNEAYEADLGWRKIFTDPNQLTSKAIAIKALREIKPVQTRHDDDDFAFDKEIYI